MKSVHSHILMATESHQSSNSELDMLSDCKIIDTKKLQQIANPLLAQKLNVLPTLFSNYQLSDHQLQPENIDNILNQHEEASEAEIYQEPCLLVPDNKEKVSKVIQKRSFLKKLLSFSSVEEKYPCSTQKDSVKIKLKKVKSLVTKSGKESPSLDRKNLQNKSKSLNTAYNSAFNLRNMTNESVIKDVKSDTFINKNFNVTTTTTVYESSPTALIQDSQKLTNSPLSFFNVGFMFNRNATTGLPKANYRNYKEKVTSLNVRRKSSMINSRCIVDCTRTQIVKSKRISKNIENEWMDQKVESLRDTMNSDCFYFHHKPEDYVSSTYENVGILMGVSDIDFRNRLIRLQRKHREFNHASSRYLTTGSIKITKRKKAFDAVDLNLNAPLNLSFEESSPNLQYLSQMVSLVSEKLIIFCKKC